MIRCSCCERRLGHSLAACDCTAGTCNACLLCPTHCQCEWPLVVEPNDDRHPDD